MYTLKKTTPWDSDIVRCKLKNPEEGEKTMQWNTTKITPRDLMLSFPELRRPKAMGKLRVLLELWLDTNLCTLENKVDRGFHSAGSDLKDDTSQALVSVSPCEQGLCCIPIVFDLG